MWIRDSDKRLKRTTDENDQNQSKFK